MIGQPTIRQRPWWHRLWPLLGAASFLAAWALLLLIAVRLIPSNHSDQASSFTLEGLAGAASFALATAGALFALREYRRAEQNRAFRLHLDVVHQMMRPELIEARRWVIEHIDPLDSSIQDEVEWRARVKETLFADDETGKDHVKVILNQFDEMGITFSRYWRPDPEVMVWLAPLVIKPWIRIGPYVEWEAQRRSAEGHYYYWARTLADDTCRWTQEHRAGVYHSLMRERRMEGAL